MMRFVVLHHTEIEPEHFDLMYETALGSALRTWRLPRWPPRAGDEAARIGEHRRAYLDFEGAVTGGRGRVARVAHGVCEVVESPQQLLLCLPDGVTMVRLTLQADARWMVSEAPPVVEGQRIAADGAEVQSAE